MDKVNGSKKKYDWLYATKEEFEQLISIVANQIGIPSDAVRRDYYIVMMLQNLQDSELADMCVFKGGTSLLQRIPLIARDMKKSSP